jgi:SCP-2 sterol transfer family protein
MWAMSRADPNAVASTAESFFAGLAEAGHIATFERESATIRFDIPDADERDQAAHADKAERWYVTVKDGRVSVTRQDRPADAVVRVSRPQFESIVTGRLNAQAAMLRGLLTVEGKMAAVVMFQRCLPGPPGSRGTAAPISARAVNAQRRDT